MRAQLTDVVHQVSTLFKKVRVTGTETSTKIEAFNDDKDLFLVAALNEPIHEFSGEFGIGSLTMLSGLLNFASYKADEATLQVHRNDVSNHVSEFEFRAKDGGGTRFMTMNPRLVDRADIQNIPWRVRVSPSKANIAELTQLAALCSEVDTQFGVRVRSGTLYVTIGGGAAGTHRSSVAFASTDAEDDKDAGFTYTTRHLLAVLKNAGPKPAEVRFSTMGVAGATVETDHGIYNYYLRGKSV